jgi:hypothetical protein
MFFSPFFGGRRPAQIILSSISIFSFILLSYFVFCLFFMAVCQIVAAAVVALLGRRWIVVVVQWQPQQFVVVAQQRGWPMAVVPSFGHRENVVRWSVADDDGDGALAAVDVADGGHKAMLGQNQLPMRKRPSTKKVDWHKPE